MGTLDSKQQSEQHHQWTMERRYRRLVCLIASIGILAVLAVTMFLGASRSENDGLDNSVYSGHADDSRSIGDSEGPRAMHHQKVKLAHKRCPRYQDMDGKCIDTCNGPNTAVGKVFKSIKQSQILDVLTKHDVYNICYCRGKGCHRVKKVRMATMKPTNDAESNVAIETGVTVSGSNGGTGKTKTNLMLTGNPSALRSTNEHLAKCSLQSASRKVHLTKSISQSASHKVHLAKC